MSNYFDHLLLLLVLLKLARQAGFSRQAYVMPLLLSFLFFSFFFNDRWSKEMSETAQPIFTRFLVMVDMLT